MVQTYARPVRITVAIRTGDPNPIRSGSHVRPSDVSNSISGVSSGVKARRRLVGVERKEESNKLERKR